MFFRSDNGRSVSRARSLAAALLTLTAVSSFASAQVMTDGDSSFNLPAANTTGATVRTGTTGGTAAVFTAGGDTTDQLFQQWWWYRVNGVSAREFGFSGRTAANVAGNQLVLDYTEPEGFTARITYTLTDGANAPAACNVACAVAITNTGAAPLSIAVFGYIDYDIEGTLADTASLLAPGRIGVADATGFTAQFYGVNAAAYEVSAFATLRNRLTDADIDDLANTGLPFASADFSGALQWNLDIAAGATQTIRSAFSLNTDAVAGGGCVGDFNNSGGVTVQDIFDFLVAYFANSPSADVNASGSVTVQDIFDFLVGYFAGCP